MSGACTPLVVVEETGTDIVVILDVGSDPDTVGDNAGVALAGGSVTCCGEEVLIVGVQYNNQWRHDGFITYDAQVA